MPLWSMLMPAVCSSVVIATQGHSDMKVSGILFVNAGVVSCLRAQGSSFTQICP